MRSILSVAGATLLGGCALLQGGSGDCSREAAALRAHDAQIAYAERRTVRGFTANLVTRGNASHFCMTGQGGDQLRCMPAAYQPADMDAMYRQRDAIAARAERACAS